MIEVAIVAEEFLPVYKNDGDAGADLKSMKNITVKSEETVVIPTGIRMSIPEGYEAQIRPRSGLAAKQNVMAILGTIDSPYRGEVGVIFHNFGKEKFEIKKGDRIAQIVFNKVEKAEFLLVSELDKTVRGNGGFGSTGI